MTETEPSEAVVTAWVRLMRAQQVALAAVESELKAGDFPPLSWYDALLELRRADHEALRPLELEDRLLLAQHNVSRLIDRLEAAGYVERRRCASDGRGQMVCITTSGLALLDRMWPVYRAAIARHVGMKLGDDASAATLAGLLGRLID